MPTKECLPVPLTVQKGKLLCWAEVADAISEYYHGRDPTRFCDIVHAIVGAQGCCNGVTVGPDCDQGRKLGAALGHTKNGGGPAMPTAKLWFSKCRTEITLLRPLALREDAHARVISGYIESAAAGDESRVEILDPLGERKLVKFSAVKAMQGEVFATAQAADRPALMRGASTCTHWTQQHLAMDGAPVLELREAMEVVEERRHHLPLGSARTPDAVKAALRDFVSDIWAAEGAPAAIADALPPLPYYVVPLSELASLSEAQPTGEKSFIVTGETVMASVSLVGEQARSLGIGKVEAEAAQVLSQLLNREDRPLERLEARWLRVAGSGVEAIWLVDGEEGAEEFHPLGPRDLGWDRPLSGDAATFKAELEDLKSRFRAGAGE